MNILQAGRIREGIPVFIEQQMRTLSCVVHGSMQALKKQEWEKHHNDGAVRFWKRCPDKL